MFLSMHTCNELYLCRDPLKNTLVIWCIIVIHYSRSTSFDIALYFPTRIYHNINMASLLESILQEVVCPQVLTTQRYYIVTIQHLTLANINVLPGSCVISQIPGSAICSL